MKQIIQISEDEIKDALKVYLESNGISLEGKFTDISFIAGRQEKGLVANVDVSDEDPNAEPEKKTRKKRGPNKKKVVEETEATQSAPEEGDVNDPVVEEEPADNPPEETEPEDVPDEIEEEEEEETPSTNSLFN